MRNTDKLLILVIILFVLLSSFILLPRYIEQIGFILLPRYIEQIGKCSLPEAEPEPEPEPELGYFATAGEVVFHLGKSAGEILGYTTPVVVVVPEVHDNKPFPAKDWMCHGLLYVEVAEEWVRPYVAINFVHIWSVLLVSLVVLFAQEIVILAISPFWLCWILVKLIIWIIVKFVTCFNSMLIFPVWKLVQRWIIMSARCLIPLPLVKPRPPSARSISAFQKALLVSNEVLEYPGILPVSEPVYEKRLVKKYVQENGVHLKNGQEVTQKMLINIKILPLVKPQPPSATSIPAFLKGLAVSNEVLEHPVILPVSGHVYENRLVRKFVQENGVDPMNGQEISLRILIDINILPLVKPQPPSATSIPAFLKGLAVSNEVLEHPVILPVSGHVYENRLVRKFVQENGVDPMNGPEVSLEMLIDINTLPLVKPWPSSAASISAFPKALPVSNEVLEHQVILPVSGHVSENRLVRKYGQWNGVDPMNGPEVSLEMLIDINTLPLVKPWPSSAASISAFQKALPVNKEVLEHPVILPVSGHVYENRLVRKYGQWNGVDPMNGQEVSLEMLIDINTLPYIRPRPPSATSIPAFLKALQDQWDAVMFHNITLRQQLQTVRQELSHALYQHNVANLVIARLTKELAAARDANEIKKGIAKPLITKKEQKLRNVTYKKDNIITIRPECIKQILRLEFFRWKSESEPIDVSAIQAKYQPETNTEIKGILKLKKKKGKRTRSSRKKVSFVETMDTGLQKSDQNSHPKKLTAEVHFPAEISDTMDNFSDSVAVGDTENGASSSTSSQPEIIDGLCLDT